MRIPALVYLFGMPVKLAGTVSLLASIPTVAAGALTYRRLGHLPASALAVAVLMGAASLGGVLVGASLLPLVDRHTGRGAVGRAMGTSWRKASTAAGPSRPPCQAVPSVSAHHTGRPVPATSTWSTALPSAQENTTVRPLPPGETRCGAGAPSAHNHNRARTAAIRTAGGGPARLDAWRAHRVQ